MSDPATTLRDALAAMLIDSEMLPDWHDDDVFIAREVVSAILGVLARPEHRAALEELLRRNTRCRAEGCHNRHAKPVFVPRIDGYVCLCHEHFGLAETVPLKPRKPAESNGATTDV